jgi:hypothetical protein
VRTLGIGLIILSAVLLIEILRRPPAPEPKVEEDWSDETGDYGPIVSEYRIGRVSSAIH